MPLREAVRRLGRALWEESGPANALLTFALGVVTIALGLVGLIEAPGIVAAPAAWHLVPLTIGCLGVTQRKARPALAFAIVTPAFVADLLIGGSLALVVVMFDGLYSVERFGSAPLRRAVRFGAAVVVVGGSLAAILGGLPIRAVAAITLQAAALLLLPIWWALEVRRRTELAEAAHARAELEASRAAEQARAQAAERRAAVQMERSRMAQELHDAIAGDVSALVIRAGAALAQPPGPGDRESLAAIRQSGVHALGELRTMIDVLTDELPADDVAPRLTADGADLLRRSGVTVDGVSPAALGALAPVVDRAAYRILQESLTNAARHGRPGTTSAELRDADGRIEILVRNDVDGEPGTDHHGMGLASMAERARAVGGAVTFERRTGRWAVEARLPVVPS